MDIVIDSNEVIRKKNEEALERKLLNCITNHTMVASGDYGHKPFSEYKAIIERYTTSTIEEEAVLKSKLEETLSKVVGLLKENNCSNCLNIATELENSYNLNNP